MQKTEFIRQINELVPRPDPVTTEALYRFDRECAETEYIDMLTALRVVARNFSEETLQGAYEIIQHQNAALPSELFTAAVYLQAGRTPTEVSGLAREGRLMGFFGPERPEELSRIATCTIVESGREQRFYTMDFGRFNPQHALKRAITYGRETGISATQAMARLTMDQPEFAEKPGGPRCILDGLGSELTEALFQLSPACPCRGCPYHLQCRPGHHRDSLSSPVAGAKPKSGGHPADVKNCWILRAHCGMLCAYQKKGRESYEPSEETEHAQEPR